jgi:stearoyl-CoA desaturase (Delta-9 desaturase)
MVVLFIFAAHWYLSLFTQSFFHHRYSAHLQFKMTRFWEKFFFIISFIFQGSSYLSPYAYGIMHRMHHAYADTEKDVHSPKYDSNFFSMMWRTKVVYDQIFKGKVEIDEKFKKNVPEWHAFDSFASHTLTRAAWVFIYVLLYLAFATHWWMFLLVPIHAVMGPFHGVIINWFAHKYGYTNFEVSDTSKNLMPLDILMLGEGFHNNHHKHASRPNFGVKWFEFDPIYPFILLFDKLRIIRLNRAIA